MAMILLIGCGRAWANVDANKKALTVEHLLMMATGLPCADADTGVYGSVDWVPYILDLPLKEPPGARFEYCGAASFLLSAIIQEKTGMSAADYAQRYLFAPLGIQDVELRGS